MNKIKTKTRKALAAALAKAVIDDMQSKDVRDFSTLVASLPAALGRALSRIKCELLEVNRLIP